MSYESLKVKQPGQVTFHGRRVDVLNSSIFIRNFTLALILIPSIFSIVGLPLLAYGQSSTSSSSSSAGSDSIKKQTSGGALDVMLQPSSQPVGHSGPTSLKVQFLTKGTSTTQPHIDYEIIIKDTSGKQLFSASQLAGQPSPLHTSEGIVTIPYTFPGPGDYTIDITVYGILFNPIKPESADFTMKVT